MAHPNDKIPDDQDLTANVLLFDSVLRHQIAVRRMTTTQVASLITALARADRELVARLRSGLGDKERTRRLLRSLADLREEAMGQLRLGLVDDLRGIADIEIRFEMEAMRDALPIKFQLNEVDVDKVITSILNEPFNTGERTAHSLEAWFKQLTSSDQARVMGAVQLGLVQGEDISTIARRIAGTRANGFADGVLAVSRRAAESIVRTAVNHVSNAARESVWDANSDILAGIKWTATLDGRTTPICQSRDGKVATIGGKPIPKGSKALVPDGARPPAHPNCRSIMVGIFSDEAIAATLGTRPFVRDARTGKQRRRDFRKDARENVGEAEWKKLDRGGRESLIAQERRAWTQKNVGTVPREVTYEQWLRRQPAAFQDDVLGDARGALFRRGEVSLDRFVDRTGRNLTLKELAAMDPKIFTLAGLDPGSF